MITSDEPGLYFEGKFGIRHESLLLCQEDEKPGFLRFMPLTLVPFDRDGIDKRYLTSRQLDALNAYHKLCFESLSRLLFDDEIEWLMQVTEPI